MKLTKPTIEAATKPIKKGLYPILTISLIFVIKPKADMAIPRDIPEKSNKYFIINSQESR